MNSESECKTAFTSFGSSRECLNLPSTFYLSPSRFSLQHIKSLEYTFSSLANYLRFLLLIWSKLKNFDFPFYIAIQSFSNTIIVPTPIESAPTAQKVLFWTSYCHIKNTQNVVRHDLLGEWQLIKSNCY